MNTIDKSAFWLGVARLSSGLKLGEEPERMPKTDKPPYMAYTIERDGEHEDGNQVTILGSKILDARLKKCELGTRVKITFLGKELSSNGYEYRNSRVDKRKEGEGATTTGTQTLRDNRLYDRVAAERGEIAQPMEPITNLPGEDENEASPQQAAGYQEENLLMMRNHGFSNSSL